MLNRHSHRQASPWVMCVLLTLAAAATRADDKSDSVTFQIWSIRATHSDKEISKELEKLADALKKTFKYTGYKLLKTDKTSAELNKSVTSTLPGPYKLTLTPQKRADEKITYKLQITERKGDKDVEKLNTTVAITPERFQLTGGSAYKLEGGDDLIIAISVK
ncbi:MAG TPA: hypothetical protein VGM03_11505 [Phycisphaerae bacterium]